MEEVYWETLKIRFSTNIAPTHYVRRHGGNTTTILGQKSFVKIVV